jgi:hypothetical protein
VPPKRKDKAQAQGMTASSMFEDGMQIVMDQGWLNMASLVAVARCNQQLHVLVDRDHLWEPFLAEIKFPQTGFVDYATEEWWRRSPDIPSILSSFFVSGLRVPQRINGGRRDDRSFFVHPRDEEAGGRGLVLAHPMSFDQTDGILKDLFHGDNEVAVERSPRSIFIPRALPIECKACRVMLDSYPALFAHCEQWSHRQNMDEARGRRVPEVFVDPRNTQYYDQHLSVFRKVMALKTFEHRFIDFLHAPLNQDGLDNLTWHRLWVLRIMRIMSADPRYEDIDEEDLLSIATLEKVREACIEFVLNDFYHVGIDGYSLVVILAGWQEFSLRDIISRSRLYSIIMGT